MARKSIHVHFSVNTSQNSQSLIRRFGSSRLPSSVNGIRKHCTLSNVGEYVVCGQYVADYSTTECRTFQPEGIRHLHTKLRMYGVRLVYIAMGNCV